jgi:hypothetical protein
MLLEPPDGELFFRLHRALMFLVNQRLKIIDANVATPDDFASHPPEVRLKLRDAFLAHTDLIPMFVDENPSQLSGDELDIIRSWRHLVSGKFYVFRELKKYTVFLSSGIAKPRPKPRVDAGDVLKVIVGMIDQFCKQHLNEEYAVLCRRLAEKLSRKRPSPLLGGSPNTWASGIVRTIGWVNFLHDKTQTPYMRLGDIDAHFGISESTGAAKLATIRKMLKIYQLDPNWTLPSRLDDNPMAWILEVNGFLVDVRSAPREVQETAFNKGLIPYIPADRESQE